MTPPQFGAGQVAGPAEPIQNADGTITVIHTFKGVAGEAVDCGWADAVAGCGWSRWPRRSARCLTASLSLLGKPSTGARTAPEPESGLELFCEVLIPALT
jgi:hypothetical protein